MFDYKFDRSLSALYEDIQKNLEPSIEELLNDIKNDPKRYLIAIMKKENLPEILSKYIEETDKEDGDLGILATVISQIIKKTKEEIESNE